MSSSEGGDAAVVNSGGNRPTGPGTSYDDSYAGQYHYPQQRSHNYHHHAPVGQSMSLEGSLDSLAPASLLDQRLHSLEKQLDIELKVQYAVS
jgi:hypothetical protein